MHAKLKSIKHSWKSQNNGKESKCHQALCATSADGQRGLFGSALCASGCAQPHQGPVARRNRAIHHTKRITSLPVRSAAKYLFVVHPKKMAARRSMEAQDSLVYSFMQQSLNAV
jgi:hypothetical protein